MKGGCFFPVAGGSKVHKLVQQGCQTQIVGLKFKTRTKSRANIVIYCENTSSDRAVDLFIWAQTNFSSMLNKEQSKAQSYTINKLILHTCNK